MDMSLTGVRRYSAVLLSFRAAFLVVCALCTAASIPAEDCGAGLSSQEKLARFKQLDREAETAMQQHRPEDAITAYQQDTCLFPNSARAYYGLGMAQAATGKFNAARESLRTADRLDPKTPMPLMMQVRVNDSLRDMDSLKSNLRDLAARFPAHASVHTAVARFLAEHNLFVLALAEALRSGRNGDSDAMVQLSVLENTVGAYADAVRNGLAVEQNHTAPDAVRGAAAGVVGLSYESLAQPEEAARYLREAIQLDPSQENSYLALADLLDQQQRYADAVNVLQQARKAIPDSGAVMLALGSDMIRAEQYTDGVALLQELLRAAPDTIEAYVSIAEAGRKSGNAEQEVSALRQVEHRKPDYPMIHVLLARAMLNQQPAPYAAILDELQLAAKSSANDPDVYALEGKVYLGLGRYSEALRALDRSVALRPTDPAGYYELARVYQKLGKPELARQQFERVKYLQQSAAK